MKIIEIHCDNWFLKDSIAGITLYPFIFYNKNHKFYKDHFKTLQRHEFIHVDQVYKMGWLKFYFSYVFVRGFKEKVEREAYEGQNVNK